MLTEDPGIGKSYVTLGISAEIARRGGKTVYLTSENSAAYTLRPRFDALQGDASKLILLEGNIVARRYSLGDTAGRRSVGQDAERVQARTRSY